MRCGCLGRGRNGFLGFCFFILLVVDGKLNEFWGGGGLWRNVFVFRVRFFYFVICFFFEVEIGLVLFIVWGCSVI